MEPSIKLVLIVSLVSHYFLFMYLHIFLAFGFPSPASPFETTWKSLSLNLFAVRWTCKLITRRILYKQFASSFYPHLCFSKVLPVFFFSVSYPSSFWWDTNLMKKKTKGKNKKQKNKLYELCKILSNPTKHIPWDWWMLRWDCISLCNA